MIPIFFSFVKTRSENLESLQSNNSYAMVPAVFLLMATDFSNYILGVSKGNKARTLKMRSWNPL